MTGGETAIGSRRHRITMCKYARRSRVAIWRPASNAEQTHLASERDFCINTTIATTYNVNLCILMRTVPALSKRLRMRPLIGRPQTSRTPRLICNQYKRVFTTSATVYGSCIADARRPTPNGRREKRNGTNWKKELFKWTTAEGTNGRPFIDL